MKALKFCLAAIAWLQMSLSAFAGSAQPPVLYPIAVGSGGHGTTFGTNYVTQRAPLAGDDISRGYVPGNLWLDQNGQVWGMYQQGTPNGGTWIQIGNPCTLPLDAVPMATSGGFAGGMVKMATSWTGAAVRATDGSTTHDVPFAKSGCRSIADMLDLGAWVTANAKPSGFMTVTNNPSVNNTMAVNGVTYTAVASGATGTQFNIGSTPSITAANFQAVLAASANTSINIATYTNVSGTPIIGIVCQTTTGCPNFTMQNNSNFYRSATTLLKTAYADTIYDESGAANNITQTGAGMFPYAPRIGYVDDLGRFHYATSNGVPVISFDDWSFSAGGRNAVMVIPAAVTSATGQTSVFLGIENNSPRTNSAILELAISSGYRLLTTGAGSATPSPTAPYMTWALGNQSNPPVFSTSSPSVMGFISNTGVTLQCLFVNNQNNWTGGSVASVGGACGGAAASSFPPSGGGFLGSASSIYTTVAQPAQGGNFNLTSFLYYPARLTCCGLDSQQAGVNAALYSQLNIAPQIIDHLIMDSDSRGWGIASLLNENRERIADYGVARPYVKYNVGYPGFTSGQRCADVSADVLPVINTNPNALNVIEFIASINDMTSNVPATNDTTSPYNAQSCLSGYDGTTLFGKSNFTNIVDYFGPSGVGSVCTGSVNCKLLVGTIEYSTNSQTQPSGCTLGTNCGYDKLAVLNPAIRGLLTSGKVNGVIDLANDPLMGLYATTSNQTYFVDGTHATPRGYSIFGSIISKQVQQAWP